MERSIVVDDDEHKLIENKDGSVPLLRYNLTTKMWIKLIFSKEHHPEIEEYVMGLLAGNFISELVEKAAR